MRPESERFFKPLAKNANSYSNELDSVLRAVLLLTKLDVLITDFTPGQKTQINHWRQGLKE